MVWLCVFRNSFNHCFGKCPLHSPYKHADVYAMLILYIPCFYLNVSTHHRRLHLLGDDDDDDDDDDDYDCDNGVGRNEYDTDVNGGDVDDVGNDGMEVIMVMMTILVAMMMICLAN